MTPGHQSLAPFHVKERGRGGSAPVPESAPPREPAEPPAETCPVPENVKPEEEHPRDH